MKKNRLLSLGAMALAISCATSVSASAAEYNKTPGQAKEAIIKMAEKAYKGEKVINGLNITVNTPITDYATGNLTKEMDKLADELGLTGFDYSRGLKDNFLIARSQSATLTENDKNLLTIKNYLNTKLGDFISANEEGQGCEYVRTYIKVSKYGTLKAGFTGEGENAVALLKNGQIIGIIGNDELQKVQNQLDRVETWDQLINFLNNNGIQDIIN
ncbi:hypothetical protein ACQPUR_16970 [Clostridium neonatale]|uniref:hypothetical protein n=1 Tax=Clostridium neonatale TaxID=137838 RepID=UPI003D330761